MKEYHEFVSEMKFPETNVTRKAFDAGVESSKSIIDDLRQRKDAAYEERNRLVAALAHMFPAGVARTSIPGWSEDWHGCVYIDLPTGQVSWHFHDSHTHLFDFLPPYIGKWDGHTTEEKYRRLSALFEDSELTCGCDDCTAYPQAQAVSSGVSVGGYRVTFVNGESAQFNELPELPVGIVSTVEYMGTLYSSNGITVGQSWRHHSGRVYEVIGFANQYTSDPEKFPVSVIYRGHVNGKEWVRPLSVFLQKFTLIYSSEVGS